MLLFLGKKAITPLFYPLSIVFILLLLGLILVWRNKRRKAGLVSIIIGFVVLTYSSFGFLANGFIRTLEGQYPPLMISESSRPGDVQWVVVLGGGHTADPALPVSSQIGDHSLVRLFEGVRLYRLLPGSKLILSGGSVFQKEPEAETMALAARTMGVPPSDIIKEGQSRDTEDQVRFLKGMLGASPFVLVTSAMHMPRSMIAFRSKGLRPIAAPTGHVVASRESFAPRDFYPSPETLWNVEMAVHEYLGMLWIKVRDRIRKDG